MKKAILVGYGGIGKSVYYPELQKLGYEIDIVDPLASAPANKIYTTVNNVPKHNHYDIAIICCPNAHHLNAVLELSDVCTTILVEKPGLANTKAWRRTIERFPNHTILMVKNNLYRESAKTMGTLFKLSEISKIEVNWLNINRIPNPGGWFTNSRAAYGGVAYDLMPHLMCFMYALLPWQLIKDAVPKTFQMQRWQLSDLDDDTATYGAINKNGVYDVCDYAEAHYMIPREKDAGFVKEDCELLPVTLRASWKEGLNDQAIHIYYKDGASINLEFGLCPSDAYGKMIDNVANDKFIGHDRQTWEEQDLDIWIHSQLEQFGVNNEN